MMIEATLARATGKTRAACPVCDRMTGTSFPGHRLQPREKGDPGPQFYACGGCGLRFQQPQEGEDGSIYADVEVAAEEQGHTPGALLRLDADALQIFKRFAPGPRLLDIGSGDGRFLAAAAEFGFLAEGVDVSARIAETARRNSGCPVRVGRLEELGLAAESYGAVNLDLVLMYVPDPVAMLAEIHRILTPGGVCRIREYVSDSVNAIRQGRRWWFYCESALRVYSHGAMHRLARRTGFQVARCYPGTEASYDTWREYLSRKARKAKRPEPTPLRSLSAFALKKAALGPISLAADRTYYLRKPE